ncbi:hypothetical protein PHLGIDRAFT_122921 [Phlebiopsis gigantea 11061_1 CR5-6]|uniref:Protein kinase domain-containing protein n=1 Tax=Phlebiopsis gigantea (strain 11061_1 CR5-6) TaxID=745531 RepID=A0A0C3NBS4_PHLG1|nr:hypothetical protein PHLGIDRAFT_122921 [Phlebiopsis gigantea 11061_1 CR5-6]
METQVLVFIKDQWRPIAPGAHPELETYDRLREHSVACVATCLGGGDVCLKDKRVQRTLTHTLLPNNIGIDNSDRHHTRLVIKEIGRPLSQYPNTIELMTIMYHALLGHSEAWEDAGVLHRDISPGNIMIDVNSPANSLQGFLNDWDMCKYKEDLDNNVPALPGRSGTWATLSALALQYPQKPHEVADDLESAVYVLLQMALRFQRHSKTPRIDPDALTMDELREANNLNEPLASFVSNFFDAQHECEDGYWYGGETKRSWLEGTSLPVALDPGENGETTPLAILLGDLYNLMRRHYAAINFNDLKRFKVPLKSTTKSTGQADNEDTVESADAAGKKQSASEDSEETVDPLTRVKAKRGKARPQNPVLPQDLPPQAELPAAPVVLAQPDHIRTQPMGEAHRVLDTHEELLKAFERILYVDGENKTQPRNARSAKRASKSTKRGSVGRNVTCLREVEKKDWFLTAPEQGPLGG